MKALILDDMNIRHKNLKTRLTLDVGEIGHVGPDVEVFHAHRFFEAVKLVQQHEFDIMCLDHDLGDKDPANADRAPTFHGYAGGAPKHLTGADFCDWLVQSGNIPDTVWIHSANPAGAKNMELALRGKSTKSGKRAAKIMVFQAPGASADG